MNDLLTPVQLQQRAPVRKYEEIPLPSPYPKHDPTPVKVKIRNIFGGEWSDLLGCLVDEENNRIPWKRGRLWELLVAFCWVDENNKRVMRDEDILADWWRGTDRAFFEEFLLKVRLFNDFLFGPGLEPARKNSEATAGDDLLPESPPTSDSTA